MIRTVLLLSGCTLAIAEVSASASAEEKGSCRFAPAYSCDDFSDPATVDEYLSLVMKWEGKFAQPNVGYDAVTG